MQTVTTNDPAPGRPANQPFADTDLGQATPFYYNPKEQKRAEERAKEELSASTFFVDSPKHNLIWFLGSTIYWNADLSLVGINSDGSFDILKTFSYGFTLDAKGVHLEELREKK